tara:strand:- start:234 stop:746 length:513 start_codon:yes stop_codon:yes gene_type:complete
MVIRSLSDEPKIKVVDDFLPQNQFNNLQEFLMGPYFPWFYNDNIIRGDYSRFQFIHTFYKENSEHNSFLSLFDESQRLLEVKKLFRIKSNLKLKTLSPENTGYHIDNFVGSNKTAVLYINTNNGGTSFKGGGMVKSLANRIVIFNSELEHAGITCTDENIRVVVNFNYVG